MTGHHLGEVMTEVAAVTRRVAGRIIAAHLGRGAEALSRRGPVADLGPAHPPTTMTLKRRGIGKITTKSGPPKESGETHRATIAAVAKVEVVEEGETMTAAAGTQTRRSAHAVLSCRRQA